MDPSTDVDILHAHIRQLMWNKRAQCDGFRETLADFKRYQFRYAKDPSGFLIGQRGWRCGRRGYKREALIVDFTPSYSGSIRVAQSMGASSLQLLGACQPNGLPVDFD